MTLLLCAAAPADAAPGEPSPGFGTDGAASVAAYPDRPLTRRQTTIDLAGRLVVAGRSGRGDVVVQRLLPDMSPDRSFGDRGRTAIDLGTVADDVAGVHVRDDGRIVIGASSATELVAIGLRRDGVLDADWGTGGLVRTAVPRNDHPGGTVGQGPTLAEIQHSTLASDGDVVLAGRLSDTGQLDPARFLFVRIDDRGRRVNGFGTDGASRMAPWESTLIGTSIVDGIVADPDGTLVVTGTEDPTYGYRHLGALDAAGRLTRFTPAPFVDPAQFPPAVTPRDPRPLATASLLRMADGRLLIGRTSTIGSPSGPRRPSLEVRLASGAVDTTFGDEGRVVDPTLRPETAALDGPAGILVVTTAGAVVRYGADGRRDETYAPDATGDVVLPRPGGAALVDLDADGRPGAVRTTTLSAEGAVVGVAERDDALQGGTPGSTGLDAAEQSDGRIVVLTAVDGRTGGLGRVTADGRPDRTFGRDGVVDAPRGTASWRAPFAVAYRFDFVSGGEIVAGGNRVAPTLSLDRQQEP